MTNIRFINCGKRKNNVCSLRIEETRRNTSVVDADTRAPRPLARSLLSNLKGSTL